MRGHGLTVLFGLVVVGFFALVAAEDYAWTSADAYFRVRVWELIIVVVLIVGFYLLLGIYTLIDWCQMKIDKFRRRNRH